MSAEERVPDEPCVLVRFRALEPAWEDNLGLNVYRCLGDGAAAVACGISDARGEFQLGSAGMASAAGVPHTRTPPVDFRLDFRQRFAADGEVTVGLA